jgi:hypothetical protein
VKVTKNLRLSQGILISIVVFPVISLLQGSAQAKPPQITQEAVTANCANVVITGGIATFTCTGLTVDQAKVLKDVPTLLTRILKEEKLSTEEIISRLNTCVEQSASRRISSDDKLKLTTAVHLETPLQYTIIVRATNSTPESSRYAQEIWQLFKDSGWNTPPVFYNSVIGAPVSGVTVVYINSASSAPGNIINNAFAGRIKADFAIGTDLDANTVVLVIGPKPVD